jgi:hypothetical protein
MFCHMYNKGMFVIFIFRDLRFTGSDEDFKSCGMVGRVDW